MALQTIDVNTLKSWLDKDEAVVIDVREPAEYKAESITGATLLPLGKIHCAVLPEHCGKKLVLHCRKGGRGGMACQKLIAEDPTLELYHLEGGIEAWKMAGFGVASSDVFFLSLDRQVQLTIGLFVLAGSVLGYLVSQKFLFVTGFFGAGLTFAGLTGFCGLAMLMAKMPWNQ